MQESYIEGLASHDDPESCVGSREGAGEALTGACAGTVLSRENYTPRVPTQLNHAEGNTGSPVFARDDLTLRGRRPVACTEPSRARTGRSHGCSSLMVRRDASERLEAISR